MALEAETKNVRRAPKKHMLLRVIAKPTTRPGTRETYKHIVKHNAPVMSECNYRTIPKSAGWTR